jgi:hypothetical protein
MEFDMNRILVVDDQFVEQFKKAGATQFESDWEWLVLNLGVARGDEDL